MIDGGHTQAQTDTHTQSGRQGGLVFGETGRSQV